MPQTRKMSLDELKTYARFARVRFDFTEIEQKLQQGSVLELVSSTFQDAGPDYTAVKLDGRVIAHMDGF